MSRTPNRPNPEGWKGGSEDFDTVWTGHGRKTESPVGIWFDTDDDPDCEHGVTDNHFPDSDV